MTNSESSSDTTDYSNYVMYLRTVQSSAIRVLIEALKEILTDTNLEFDGTNISRLFWDWMCFKAWLNSGFEEFLLKISK